MIFHYYLFHWCLPDCFIPPKLLLSARNCCFSHIVRQKLLLQSTRNCVLPDFFILPETAASVRQKTATITVFPNFFILPETAAITVLPNFFSLPEIAAITVLPNYFIF